MLPQYENYDDLVQLIHESGREYNLPLIEKAYLFANAAHGNQRRASGDPYIVHPISVACILVNLGMDDECIVAALLHDVVEDTDIGLAEIEQKFGKVIAELIDGLTKLSKLGYFDKEQHQAENIRKMLIAMNRDIRVVIVKLADRLNNMRTIEALNEQKRRDIAKETMEIYAPIAHRLGIRPVKEELEDLSLRQIDPFAYKTIVEQLAAQQSSRETFLRVLKTDIAESIHKELPNAAISGRIKSVHGIFKKMYVQQKDFSDIYDVYAVRIIVDTVAECYAALGIIHTMYIPMPNRFKDYITMPKANGYKSLHTTVIRKQDESSGNIVPFEVQIRTKEMHQTAEFGIAAHWKYKEGVSGRDSLEERLAWIRKMLENQSEAEDATELVQQIKSEMVPDEVYVFTPKGDVKCLPSGAIVIDFAYAIHSQVGHRMIGARVNGKMVPFTYKVKNGDIVEIQTTKEITTGPKRDWLKMVKTGEAKNKIRSWFKNERREENIVNGREELFREFKRNGIRLPENSEEEFLSELARKAHAETIEDFYAAIGYGGIVLSRIMQRVKDDYNRMMKANAQPTEGDIIEKKDDKPHSNDGVYIEGIDNCMVKMSKCCNPLPGDEIIGYITRGFGVSIHKRSCVNVPLDITSHDEPHRWVKARWSDKITAQNFKAALRIYCNDRDGILADVTTQLSNMHVGISFLNSRNTKDGHGIISVTISVSGKEHLDTIIAKLSKINDIISIERAAD